MANLFEFLEADLPNTMENMVRGVQRSLYVQESWIKDLRHECYAAWLSNGYEPHYTRTQILSYAYRCARLACLEWRRKTIVVVGLDASVSPEPVGIHFEHLMGEDKEKFLQETNLPEQNPEYHYINQDEINNRHTKPDFDLTLDHVELPADKSGNKKYDLILKNLAEGLTFKKTAEIVKVSDRTIYRRVQEIIRENENRKIFIWHYAFDGCFKFSSRTKITKQTNQPGSEPASRGDG